MIMLTEDQPTFGEFFAFADHYQLVPDYWHRIPEAAALEFSRRAFWTLYDDDVVIGYVWIDGYIPEIPEGGCNFGAVVSNAYRGGWKQYVEDELYDILRMCFGAMAVPRVTVMLDRQRTWTERFFKWLGFEYEGRIPKGMKVNGKWVTVNHLGMTAERFRYIEEQRHVAASNPPGHELAWRGAGEEKSGPVQLPGPAAGNRAGQPDQLAAAGSGELALEAVSAERDGAGPGEQAD